MVYMTLTIPGERTEEGWMDYICKIGWFSILVHAILGIYFCSVYLGNPDVMITYFYNLTKQSEQSILSIIIVIIITHLLACFALIYGSKRVR